MKWHLKEHHQNLIRIPENEFAKEEVHARETMIESLQKSIVIITDNQRYSVAITYDINSDEDDPVPTVAAKGEGTVFRWINHEAENTDLF